MPHRVFNLDEVAEYLHMTRGEVDDLVRAGEIPCEQPGGRPVFRRADIDGWASRRLLGFKGDEMKDFHRRTSDRHARDESAPHAPILPGLIPQMGIDPALCARTRASLIREIAAMADRTGWVNNIADLRNGLERRETMASTALPGGIAMLHPDHHDPWLFEESFVLLARSVQELPFGSPDGLMTRLFFLIACRDEKLHLHLLARLCEICRKTDAIECLLDAADADAMRAVLLESEEEVLQTMNRRHPG